MSDSITEKIRKLLRLAKSPNAAEADAALAKAMELAARHQVDASELADDDEVSKFVTRYFTCGGRRLSREWREALALVREFFNVTTCIMTGLGKVAFVGTETDVQIADYVTSFVVQRCRAELSTFTKKEKHRRRRMSKNKRASFITAFFSGLWVQLKKQREQQLSEINGFAIVLQNAKEARSQHLEGEFGETTTCKALDKPRHVISTLFAGYDAGLNTQINPALGADAPLALDYSA